MMFGGNPYSLENYCTLDDCFCYIWDIAPKKSPNLNSYVKELKGQILAEIENDSELCKSLRDSVLRERGMVGFKGKLPKSVKRSLRNAKSREVNLRFRELFNKLELSGTMPFTDYIKLQKSSILNELKSDKVYMDSVVEKILGGLQESYFNSGELENPLGGIVSKSIFDEARDRISKGGLFHVDGRKSQSFKHKLFKRHLKELVNSLYDDRGYMDKLVYRSISQLRSDYHNGKSREISGLVRQRLESDAKVMLDDIIERFGTEKNNYLDYVDMRDMQGIYYKKIDAFVSSLFMPGPGGFSGSYDSLVILRPYLGNGFSPGEGKVQREGRLVADFVRSASAGRKVIACIHYSRYAAFRDIEVEFTSREIRSSPALSWTSGIFDYAHNESRRVSEEVNSLLYDVDNWNLLLDGIKSGESCLRIGSYDLNLLGFRER